MWRSAVDLRGHFIEFVEGVCALIHSMLYSSREDSMSKSVPAPSPHQKGESYQNGSSTGTAIPMRSEIVQPSHPTSQKDDAQLRQMIDSLPQLVWTCTPDGRCDYLGRNWVDYTGIPASEQVGFGWLNQIHPEDQTQLYQKWGEAVASGSEFQGEFRIRRHDREYRWFDTRAIPVHDSDGKLVKWVGSNTDITERLQNEQVTAHLAAIVESSQSGIVSKDLNGIITSWNAAAERIFGYSASEMLGRPVRDLIPPDRQHEEDEILRRIRQGERVDHMETVRRRKDGRLINASITVSPIKSAAGKVIGVSKIVRDITARKRTELDLIASQERFRLMVDGARDYAIVILDADGRINAWNSGAERIHGFSEQEILGQNFSIFHTPEELENRKAERLLTAATAKNRVADEGWLVRKNGSRFWADIVLTALPNDDGSLRGFCHVTRDMTERLELEKKFNELQKRELATQLTTGVAHRFNNILCEILVNSELALAELPEGNPLREYIEPIKTSGERAARITRQLLSFSPQLTSAPMVFDLAAALRDMEPALRATLKENTKLALHLDAPIAMVNLDPEQLKVLALHLAANANEAMPDGGKLIIRLTKAKIANSGVVTFAMLPPGDYVRLTFTDTGSGMNEETKAHLFEPFFTTKGPSRDGLGLAVCQNIIKQCRGHVQVSSNPGQGTSVDIYFPSIRRRKTAFSSEPPTTELPRGTETLLLVDDDSALRAMTSGFLKKLGYNTVQASDGADALAQIRNNTSQPIDMLITDGRMPGMSGRELANEFHASFPKAQVLFISGFPIEPGGVSRLTGFDSASLPKPFSLPELARKLREMLDH
jgi:PAS domain S-box-containing protein